MTTATVAAFGPPQSCQEAAMKPFERMTEAERVEHLLGPHELPDIKAMYGDLEEEIVEAHQIDHDEWIADQHEHTDRTCEGSVGPLRRNDVLRRLEAILHDVQQRPRLPAVRTSTTCRCAW